MVLTATLWRGAMIDRFAKAEFFVRRCLIGLKERGIAVAPGGLAGPAGSRIGILTDMLATSAATPRITAARASLEALAARWTLRNALAHGVVRTLTSGVTIQWTPADSNSAETASWPWTASEMLEVLVEIDALQRRLGSQLGQLDDLSPAIEERA